MKNAKFVYHVTEIINILFRATDENAGVLRLDWVSETMSDGELCSSLINETFKAQTISIYMSGTEGGASRQIVTEVEVYGR